MSESDHYSIGFVVISTAVPDKAGPSGSLRQGRTFPGAELDDRLLGRQRSNCAGKRSSTMPKNIWRTLSASAMSDYLKHAGYVAD